MRHPYVIQLYEVITFIADTFVKSFLLYFLLIDL